MSALRPNHPQRARRMTVTWAVMTGIALAITMAILPSAAHAAGSYTVDITSTANSGWWMYGNAAYHPTQQKVSTGIGSYHIGDNRFWRFNVPDTSVRIDGGTIAGRSGTPNDSFEARVRQGTFGGAVVSILADKNSTTFSKGLAADSSWLEFGLVATTSTSTTIADANWVVIDSIRVNASDLSDPTLSASALPIVDHWYGPGDCVPFAYTSHDAGSGVASTTVFNDTTQQTIDSWATAWHAGLQPGTVDVSRSGCIQGSTQANGVNSYRITAGDASGRGRSIAFTARFDLTKPVVSGCFADGTHVAIPRPTCRIDASDAGSGLASITATIDGTGTPLVAKDGGWIFTPDHDLAVGSHTLIVTVTDADGNSATLGRTFFVDDTTAPTVMIDQPGGNGPAVTMVRAHGTDSQSALDPSSWQILVDGAALPVSVAGDVASATTGNLAPGTHAIEVSVRDALHNLGSAKGSYVVDGQASTSALGDVGTKSGIFLTAPVPATVPWGSTVSLHTMLARHGLSLAGSRVTASIGGVDLDSQIADANGVARLSFVARLSGVVNITAPGSSLDGVSVTLSVSPILRIRIANVRPRRGSVVKLSGSVLPAAQVGVVLEARVGGSWYPVRKRVKVGRRGRFTATVTSTVRGPVAIRVRSIGSASWASATSNVVLLHVR